MTTRTARRLERVGLAVLFVALAVLFTLKAATAWDHEYRDEFPEAAHAIRD